MAKNRYKPNGDDGKTLSFSGKLKILEAVNRNCSAWKFGR